MMFFGILPFLVQWLALYQDVGYISQQVGYNYQSYPPKNHWTLLTELNQLPEEEIEAFLPQIYNILIDCDRIGAGDGGDSNSLYRYFEDVLLRKCADCLPFGMRLCGLLKVTLPLVLYVKLVRRSPPFMICFIFD